MKLETRSLLLAADCPRGQERPETYPFDPDAAWRDIEAARERLEAVIGETLEVDRQVQDASFLADLYVLSPAARVNEWTMALYFDLCVRFSAFGRLFTVFTHAGRLNDARFDLARIVETVRERGFHYVPAGELREPYDGANEALRGDPGISWWTRYFDYL